MFSRITPLLTLAALALASTPTEILGDIGSIDNVATAFQGALALVPLSPTVANAEVPILNLVSTLSLTFLLALPHRSGCPR